MAEITNLSHLEGSLADAMKGADVFLGISAAGCVSEEMVKSMAKDPILFAMANPTPEIMPDIAKKAGAAVVGTGRSDFPNQINFTGWLTSPIWLFLRSAPYRTL